MPNPGAGQCRWARLLAKYSGPVYRWRMIDLLRIHRVSSALLILAAVLAGTPAWAHHSWARYDNENVVTMTGVLTAVEFSNPHVVMRFTVAGADGKQTEWTMEMDPPTLLLRFGLRHDTFAAGMPITITGVLARSGAAMMRAVTLEAPDGTVYRVSSRI
jgi:hypothetical protein